MFNIDIETCQACGGAIKVISCIEDPLIIEKILAYPDKEVASVNGPVAGSRGTATGRVVRLSDGENAGGQVLFFMEEGHSDVRSVNGKPSRNADKCQIYKVVCMPTWMSYRKQEGEKIG